MKLPGVVGANVVICVVVVIGVVVGIGGDVATAANKINE